MESGHMVGNCSWTEDCHADAELPKAVTFDVVSLQEAVDHRGQRIESFSVDVWDGFKWKTMDEQTTVGHNDSRWNSPVTSDQVRIRITGSRLEPTLAEVGLFKQAEFVQAPVISERDANGLVTIGGANDFTWFTRRMARRDFQIRRLQFAHRAFSWRDITSRLLGARWATRHDGFKIFAGLAPSDEGCER